ncbi:hypothetical protein SEVIR_1G043850v4 [Setaria viridis]
MHGSEFYRIKIFISSLNPPFSLLPLLLPPAWTKPRSSRSAWTKLRPWHRSELARDAVPPPHGATLNPAACGASWTSGHATLPSDLCCLVHGHTCNPSMRCYSMKVGGVAD